MSGQLEAKQFFVKGDRVVLTTSAVEKGINKRVHVGEVKGFGRDPWTIRVLCDGNKRPESYYFGFWERIGRYNKKRGPASKGE